MRLRTIELHQFRKFESRVRVDGLQDGVNVLCGPNEHGKSTLLAALRAALFERHGGRGDAIRSYQHHRGSTAPSVALEFEHDGVAHRIEKRFLSRASARLVAGGTAWEGDAAEERLQRLLGVSAPTRAARDAAMQAGSIWGALLVSQGDSFAQANLAEGARTTLAECLEAELGAVSGAAAIGPLLKQVQKALGELIDGYGKPRDRFKAALAEQEEAATAILSLEARRRRLEGDLAAVATARRALAREDDPAQSGRTDAALAAARRRRDLVRDHRSRLDQAQGALRLALSMQEEPQAERARRGARAAALREAEASLGRLAGIETGARERDRSAQATLARQHADFDAAGQAYDAAVRAQAVAVAALQAAERDAACRSVAAQCERAGQAAERVTALTVALSRHRLDETGLRRLQAAEIAHRRAEAAMQAQATLLELSLLPGATGGLSVDGSPVADGERLLLTRAAEIEIPGIGRIRVVPASRDQEALHATGQEAARTLRRLLDESGCETLAAAERAMSDRQAASAALERAQRELAAAAPGDAAGQLPPGVEALRRHLAVLEAGRAEALALLGLERAPDPALAAVARDEAAGQERLAREAVTRARDTLRAPEAERTLAQASLLQAAVDRQTREAERDRLAGEQAAALAAEGDEALSSRLAQAADAVAARQVAFAALGAAAPADTPEMADAEIARLEQAQNNRRTQIGALREEIAGLESRILGEEGVGLDEEIEAATRRRDAAGRVGEGYRREAAILTLLRDTLLQADRAARERYVAPLMTRLSPYLQALFPRARISLDDDFLITALGRLEGAGEAEAFGSLSHGTREQIAILSRLAYADMLLASGRPAFLVLDDALAFADRDRLERMFTILSEAGRRMQILVLTCREEVAAGLGGTRVRLREVAPAA